MMCGSSSQPALPKALLCDPSIPSGDCLQASSLVPDVVACLCIRLSELLSCTRLAMTCHLWGKRAEHFEPFRWMFEPRCSFSTLSQDAPSFLSHVKRYLYGG